MSDDEDREAWEELDRLHAEQKKLLIESMRQVKQHLGMLGVRAVKQLIHNLKDGCMQVWCDGFQADLKTNYWRKPTPYRDIETPLIVYEVSETQFEDSFHGVMLIKIKNDLYLLFSFNG